MGSKYHYRIFPVLFILFAAWTAIGAFPLVNYEEDSNNVEVGAAYLSVIGEPSAEWSYCYDDQPMVYWLLAGITRATGIGIDTIYCMICWLCMLWLGWLSTVTLHRITGISRSMLLLAWWMMPESFACGMYANSSVVAMPFFISGIWLLLRKRYILSGLLLCITPLFRVDIVCVYPIIFPLMCLLGIDWKKSLGISVLMAAAVAGTTISGVYLMGGDVFYNFNTYEHWNGAIEPFLVLKAILGCYSIPGIILIIAGVAILLRSKQYLLLSVLSLPVACDHLVFLHMGCAAKHFLYALPFSSGLCAYALQSLYKSVKNKNTAAITLASLIFLYETCYISFLKGFTNAYEEMHPAEKKRIPRLNLLTFEVSGRKVSMGIGGGDWFGTEDEIMLTSGNLFYPIAIHNLKAELAEQKDIIFSYLDGTKEDYIAYSFTYDAKGIMLMHLLENGWEISPKNHFKKYSNEWNAGFNYPVLEMINEQGRRISVRDWGTLAGPTFMLNEEVPVEKNFFRNFVLQLRSDGRPVYLTGFGYQTYLYMHYIKPIEDEHLLTCKAPGLWLVNTNR